MCVCGYLKKKIVCAYYQVNVNTKCYNQGRVTFKSIYKPVKDDLNHHVPVLYRDTLTQSTS